MADRIQSVALWGMLTVLFGCAGMVNAAELVTNGGFESNGGANSNSFTGWTVTDQVGGSGSFFAQTGTSKPTGFSCSTFPTASVPNPPQGTFAAMTVQSGPGSHILSQDVSIPVGATAQFSAVVYQNSVG